MGRIWLSGLTLLVCCSTLFAQNEEDALRYSRIGFGGTARFSSMAGAFGAVGPDMSVLSVNPAGLGWYNRNEITFAPSFYNNNISSTYNDSLSTDSRFNLRFDNFGFVFASKTDNTSENGWQAVGMGIAYNRYATYQANYAMAGRSTTSLLDSWKKTAGGSGPANLDIFNEGLAYQVYLLENINGDSTQYRDTIPDGDLLRQTKTVTTRGGMGEWVFGIGGNYSNKFYIGGSIGLPQVKYEEIDSYREREVVDTTSDFDYLEFNQSLSTKGHGFNFKFGLIYRPIDMFRIGFAFHSPTYLRLVDSYGANMSSVIGGVPRSDEAPDGNFNYSIRTPLRMIGSLALIFGKAGLLSLDYEIVDYSDSHLKSADYQFTSANAAIQSKYKAASNIRVGGEVRLLPVIFRGGVALYGSPYATGVNNNATRLYITGGVGYRDPDDKFFVDLGIVTTTEKSNYYFYDQTLVNPVHNVSKVVNVVFTCGFRY
ncbi:outer membrane protein transport protein [soil metagenome]